MSKQAPKKVVIDPSRFISPKKFREDFSIDHALYATWRRRGYIKEVENTHLGVTLVDLDKSRKAKLSLNNKK